MAKMQTFTGTVTKTYSFDVEVRAEGHEEATAMLHDLDEHDFDETPYPPGTACHADFADGAYVQASPTGKAAMDYGQLEAAESGEAADA